MSWGFASCCCSVTPAHSEAAAPPLASHAALDATSPVGSSPTAAGGGGARGGGSPLAGKASEGGASSPASAKASASGRSPMGKSQPGDARASASSPTASSPQPPKAAQEDLDTCSVASSRISVRSGASVKTTSSLASEFIQQCMPARQRGTSSVQQTMKSFVRGMVRGQQMGVISPDGALRTCTCSLDKKLTTFVIELKGSVQRIPLAEVEIFQGNEPEDIDTPLDELCATLMLRSQECISFHFSDVPARETFAVCLQVLVDGQQ